MAIPLDTLIGGAALFEHQALESQNTFRLLKLHHGKGDEISCSLHHHALGAASCPSYRALSYTWGKDANRFKIKFPNDRILMIRENLRDALRSLRDEEDDCWLWIDAICINQRSDVERNHQVRLMADIYSQANIVVAWLRSSGEKAVVAKAFEFIHAAATYNDAANPVYHYLRAHPSSNGQDWSAVRTLCGLRYWTRKWIIQELITARTVVLQAGRATCTMADLEAFCQELQQNRTQHAYRKFGAVRHVVASPAALLALERAERRHEQQPRLLHELVERYASSQCHLPCDHVYALYSLVGAHRVQLRIDYAASPMQRLVAVLDFAQTHERLSSSRTLDFANLLVRLLQVTQDDFRKERPLSEDLRLVAHTILLGTVELQAESEASIALRKKVKPLRPMPIISLDTSQAVWVVETDESLGEGVQEGVGRQDMRYFSIADSSFYGLAACRLEEGDQVWHFPGTQLVFVVRRLSDIRAVLLGRAYLFAAAENSDKLEPWLSRRLDYDAVKQGEGEILMNLAMLLEMGSFATETKAGSAAVKPRSPWRKMVWLQVVVIALSTLVFGIMLAVIIVARQ